jgi:hypothetical protein
VVWETSLSTFLLSLAFLLTLRIQKSAQRRDCVSLGLVWGAIALANPALLSFMVLSLVWLWYCLRRCRLPAAPYLLLVIVLFSLLIAPWLVRNYHVFGQFVFIRDNFGMELHLANNEHSGGLWTRSEHPGNDPEQMRKFRDMGELAYMKAEKQAAVTFIREHPLQFLRFSLQRAVYFWIGNPQATLVGNWSLAPARHLAFLLSAIAAFVGLGLCWRNRLCGTLLFVALILVYPLPYYLAHPSPRYRHAIEPEMLLLIIYMFWQLRGRKLHLPLRTIG